MSGFWKPRAEPAIAPLAVTVADAAQMTTLNQWTIRDLIKKGRLKGTRVGKRILVPVRELEKLVNGETK
jgi:excisionase family DNA binding protein